MVEKLRVRQSGFTLIELIMVILILGVLAAFALPRFSDLSGNAKAAVIENIAGAMNATIGIIKSKARAQGLSPSASNPGAAQAGYIVETEAGSSEVDYRNLCPESSAELADALDMIDHIDFEDLGDLRSMTDNRYTRIGYDIRGTTGPFTSGCYVVYDSFGSPNCTVNISINDC